VQLLFLAGYGLLLRLYVGVVFCCVCFAEWKCSCFKESQAGFSDCSCAELVSVLLSAHRRSRCGVRC
jgi:hypothetical protein